MKLLMFPMMLVLLCLAQPGVAGIPAAKDACPAAAWTAACFTHTATSRRIDPQYLKHVKFERDGFAVLLPEPREVVADNERGEVVVPASSRVGGYPDGQPCRPSDGMPGD